MVAPTLSLTKIKTAVQSKRVFFENGATRSYEFRKKQLKKLKAVIKKYETDIIEALHADLHKPEFEAYVSEVGFMYIEIEHTLKHLKKWMRPERKSTSLVHFPSSSIVYKEPLGLVLILGPWNYPFQLLMAPLVSAIAAGNCAIVKMVNQTPNVSSIIEKIITEAFEKQYISCVTLEDVDVIPEVIHKYRFDHIFFTGSLRVGKLITKAASEHLTPVTMELGGKSPCVVDKNVNLEVAAKRIAWAKAFNAGQTCIAPDYLLVHESVKESLVEKIKHYFDKILDSQNEHTEHMAHIINDKRFDALSKHLKEGKIVYGGKSNPQIRYIQPTIIDEVDMDDQIMKEEIFGPILPILTWSTFDEATAIIRKNPYPLAFYIFTKDKKTEQKFLRTFSFGGGCVNTALGHVSNPNLPFGGIGYSGMGRYHSKEGFETFSHKKSIMKTATWLDLKLKYPPYTKTKLKIAKWFLK